MTQNTLPTPLNAPLRPSTANARKITAWVLQILVALAFLAAGSAKIGAAPPMVEVFQKIGIGQWFRLLTGSLEIIGAIALLVPRATFYGAALLVVIMIGAVTAHVTILGGNPTPAIVLLALSATIAYLRRP